MAQEPVTIDSTPEELLTAKCQDCAFFDLFEDGPTVDGFAGLCRRYPPRDTRKGWPGWPGVALTDWCGLFIKRAGL